MCFPSTEVREMAHKFVLSSKPLAVPSTDVKWMIEELLVFIFSSHFHLWCLHLSKKERTINPHDLSKVHSILLVLFIPFRIGTKTTVKQKHKLVHIFKRRHIQFCLIYFSFYFLFSLTSMESQYCYILVVHLT